MKIKIKAPAGVKLHGAMHHPNQSTEASNKQIGMSQDGDTVTFDLDLLLSGKSCFAIYASVSGVIISRSYIGMSLGLSLKSVL